MVLFDGAAPPQSPATSCCSWKGATLTFTGTNYRLLFQLSNKGGGGSFQGGGAAGPDEVFTSEEEGTFSRSGGLIVLNRAFSTLPDVRLSDLSEVGSEISAQLTVALSAGEERHTVVLRR